MNPPPRTLGPTETKPYQVVWPFPAATVRVRLGEDAQSLGLLLTIRHSYWRTALQLPTLIGYFELDRQLYGLN